MSGYLSLAPYYADLFPLSEALKAFLDPHARRCREAGSAWLDIGCATGVLVQWLLHSGVEAWGSDPDPDFITEGLARLRSATHPHADDEPRLRPGALEDVPALFAASAPGVISCIGNVLPHARDWQAIEAFFLAAAHRLQGRGPLIVQTVNFDRILATRKTGFPLLIREQPDGTFLRFRRDYRFEALEQTGQIAFETSLEVNGTEIRNRSPLWVLRHEPLKQAAAAAFSRVQTFGDFQQNAWSLESPATILVAE